MSNVVGSETLTFKRKDGRTLYFPVTGDLRVDHGLAAREAFLAGRGIGPAHRWLVDDLLASGELEPLLTDCFLEPTPLNLLILPERAKIARVRLLIDYLVDGAARLPGIGRGSGR